MAKLPLVIDFDPTRKVGKVKSSFVDPTSGDLRVVLSLSRKEGERVVDDAVDDLVGHALGNEDAKVVGRRREAGQGLRQRRDHAVALNLQGLVAHRGQGAQPLAATMGGATYLGAEVDPARVARRLASKKPRYLDENTPDLDKAIDRALDAKTRRQATSIAWTGNIVDLLSRMVERKVVPDLLTDQTSAHDELNGYVPNGMPFEKAVELRRTDPAAYKQASFRTMAEHVRLMLKLQSMGAVTFDYGNNLRGKAVEGGFLPESEIRNPAASPDSRHSALGSWKYPGFVPAYIRPLFCQGKGPFRWAALSAIRRQCSSTCEVESTFSTKVVRNPVPPTVRIM